MENGVILLVCSVHLKSGLSIPLEPIRIVKIKLLFEKIFQLSNQFLGKNLPIIICGDFNSSPKSFVYKFISNSGIHYNSFGLNVTNEGNDPSRKFSITYKY